MSLWRMNIDKPITTYHRNIVYEWKWANFDCKIIHIILDVEFKTSAFIYLFFLLTMLVFYWNTSFYCELACPLSVWFRYVVCKVAHIQRKLIINTYVRRRMKNLNHIHPHTLLHYYKTLNITQHICSILFFINIRVYTRNHLQQFDRANARILRINKI